MLAANKQAQEQFDPGPATGRWCLKPAAIGTQA